MQMIGQMKAGDSRHDKRQSTGEKKRVDKEKHKTRQKWMNKEGDNNRDKQKAKAKHRLEFTRIMRKTHYSKIGAESNAKGVETYGHISTLNKQKDCSHKQTGILKVSL